MSHEHEWECVICAAPWSEPPATGLDVERLARALHDYECGCDGWTTDSCFENNVSSATDAVGIAAEYARLTGAAE